MNKLFTSLLFLAGASFVASAETLTVCDGANTSDGAPIYSYWMDRANHSQVLYPASMLEDLNGSNILELTFFNNGVYTKDLTNKELVVSMAEVEQESFAATEYISATMSQVFSGQLTLAAGAQEWTITLAVPYAYKGGNLLIDFSNPSGGTSPKINWYGENQATVQAVAKGNSLRALSFLPKVEFSYSTEVVGAMATISAKNLSFPLTFTDDSSELSVSVFNAGSVALTGSVSVEGSTAFVPTATSMDIAVGETYELYITYAPKEAGEDAAVLTIELGDAGSFEVALSGKAIAVPSDYREVFDGTGYDSTLPAGWTPWAVETYVADGSFSDATSNYDLFPSYYRFTSFEFDGCRSIAWDHVNPAANTDLYLQHYYIISPELKGKLMLRAMLTSVPATGACIEVYPVTGFDEANRHYILSDTPLTITWDKPLSNTDWSVGTANISGEARLAFFMKLSALHLVAADYSVSAIEAPAFAGEALASELSVYDIAGRPVSVRSYREGTLPSGIYIVREGVKAYKVIR